jgi:hypothetical protein
MGSGSFHPGMLPKFADDDDNDEGGGDQGVGQSPALRSVSSFAPTPSSPPPTKNLSTDQDE